MPITIAEKTIMDRSIVNHQGKRFAGSVMARITMQNSLYGYELPHSLWVPFPRNATEGRYADGAWLVTTRVPSRDRATRSRRQNAHHKGHCRRCLPRQAQLPRAPRDQRSPARFYKGRAKRATEQATCIRQARYCRHQEREANIRAARTRPSGAMLFLVNGSQ